MLSWQDRLKIFFYNILLPLLFFPAGAAGKTFYVNSLYDINDLTPGNGLCVAYLTISPPYVFPFCTLRAAVEESNGSPGEDVIELPSGNLTLELKGRGEDFSTTGDLDISDSLTILGKGAGQTVINANGLDRVLDILLPGIEVTLKNLTLQGGELHVDNASVSRGGGAIRNNGVLRLNRVVLLQHTVKGAEGSRRGGILLNSGKCYITNSTLQKGSADWGGALYNVEPGEMTLVSSTISQNDALRGAGGYNSGSLKVINSTFSTNGSTKTLAGGGLNNRGALFLEHVTIARNSSTEGGGMHNSGTVFLRNTLIGQNIGGDCRHYGIADSGGHNLDSDDSCELSKSGDMAGVAPGLRDLANYGGPTKTHALFPTSPARDNGTVAEEMLVDQRGSDRPQGEGADIGAVEYDGFPLASQLSPLLLR